MNAAETITEAIEVLEMLRGTDDDVWQIDGATDIVTKYHRMVADVWEAADAALIVRLHRTIDAQLVILRDFQDRYTDYGRLDGWVPKSPTARAQLDLARAILGEVS